MEPVVLFHFPDFPENEPFIQAAVLLLEAGYRLTVAIESAERIRLTLLNEQLSLEEHANADFIISYSDAAMFEWKDSSGVVCGQNAHLVPLVRTFLFPERTATIRRKTAETDITVKINLDGSGKSIIKTGLPFFDHMLDQIARHGLIDIECSCTGDLYIDEHHTIEDVALTFGEAVFQAIGDKRGIERYSWALPMDESLALVSLDLSGRPALQFEASLRREKVGDFPTEMTKHFFYSLAMSLRATLQMRVGGENDHHQIEALFKGFARCLRGAVSRNPRIKYLVPSSKGVL